jgi:hypothetical protein
MVATASRSSVTFCATSSVSMLTPLSLADEGVDLLVFGLASSFTKALPAAHVFDGGIEQLFLDRGMNLEPLGDFIDQLLASSSGDPGRGTAEIRHSFLTAT